MGSFTNNPIIVDLSNRDVLEEVWQRYLSHGVCPVLSQESVPPMSTKRIDIQLPDGSVWQGEGRCIQSMQNDLHLFQLDRPPDVQHLLKAATIDHRPSTIEETAAPSQSRLVSETATIDHPEDQESLAGFEDLAGEDPVDASQTPTGKESEFSDLYIRIRTLTVHQKRQLARHGNQVARQLLIRDSNKAIHPFVISNPKITLDEIQEYSKTPALAVEALKMIAQNPSWTKSSQVVFNLVRNPSMPVDLATRLVSRLSKTELRVVAHSSGIRMPVAAAARRLLIGG